MQIYPPVVFTFTRQRWSSNTFSLSLTYLTRVNIKYNSSYDFAAYYYINLNKIIFSFFNPKKISTRAFLLFCKCRQLLYDFFPEALDGF